MEIQIAGKKLSVEHAGRISARAEDLTNNSTFKPRPGAIKEDFFIDISDPDRFDRALINLLRDRSVVDTKSFDFPRKPGLCGSLMYYLRAVLWKLLRYQHDRMSSRQNRINGLIISSLEERTNALQVEIDVLKQMFSQIEDSKVSIKDLRNEMSR